LTTPESFRTGMARALEARGRLLASASNERLVGALCDSASQWCDSSYPARVRATKSLATSTHLHPDMLACGLDLTFGVMTRACVRALLNETDDPEALEHAVFRQAGPSVRLLGPRVVFHSLAGNIPGLSIPVIATSLLARSVAIVRDSVRQPALTEAFLETLAEHDADAAAMIVPVSWDAGDAAWERDVFALAERAELYGSDATLRAIRRRRSDTRTEIVDRGTRLSLGFVPSSAPLEAAARGFAFDITMYDGLGCLTPHAVLVVDRPRASLFAERLATSLDALEACWPRQRRAFDEEAARRSFIDACEVRCATHPGESLLRASADAWVVHLSGPDQPALGPGLRCVRVIGLDTDEDALAAIAGTIEPLAGIGLAGPPDDGASEHFVSRLRCSGATLICPPGRMQAPPLTWTQDGGRRLGDLLSWRTEAM
jgi:hypothetical protein